MAAAVLILVAASPARVHAQTQQADEAAIRAVIERVFDGMRTRDTVMMKSAFAEEARLYNVNRAGALTVSTPAQFAVSIASAPDGLVLDEVLHDVEIRIDANLATAWTLYDFFAGENFSHCGYNAFQLLKLGGEWKIVAISDSRRTEGCRAQRR